MIQKLLEIIFNRENSEITMSKKPFHILSALLTVFTLQACLEDNTYIYETAPQHPPGGVDFIDTNLGEGISGTIEVTRAENESSFSSYMVRWGIGGAIAGNGGEFFIAKINKNRAAITYELPVNTVVTEGVDSIVVNSYNAKGESEPVATFIHNFVNIPPIADTRPRNFVSTDDEGTAKINADFSFDAANDESEIDYYYLRFAGADGCPLVERPVSAAYQAVGASISDIIDLDYPPNDATNLLILTGTEFGEYVEDDCSNYVSAPLDTWSYIDYTLPARMPASAVEVTDTSEGIDIELQIDVSPAQYEFDVEKYAVYLGECTYIDDIPKGGGSLTHQITYEQYMETDPLKPYDSYPYRLVTVTPVTATPDDAIDVPHGQDCPHFSQVEEDIDGVQGITYGKTYKENSGEWYLIYHVDQSEVDALMSHYDYVRDGLPYFATASDNWDAQCLQVSGASVSKISCNATDPSQRFRMVASENPERPDAFYIQSVVDGRCFNRSDEDIADAWSLVDCDNSRGQQMDLVYVAPTVEDPEAPPVSTYVAERKQILMRVSSADQSQQSCAESTSGQNNVFGNWDNCTATSGVYWQFWREAMPSERRSFNPAL